MSSGYSGRSWACPFFRWDGPGKVRCEGGCVTFGDRGTFERYTGNFCASASGWSGCTLARTMTEEYEKGVSAGAER